MKQMLGYIVEPEIDVDLFSDMEAVQFLHLTRAEAAHIVKTFNDEWFWVADDRYEKKFLEGGRAHPEDAPYNIDGGELLLVLNRYRVGTPYTIISKLNLNYLPGKQFVRILKEVNRLRQEKAKTS
jgi:hypothetical protein